MYPGHIRNVAMLACRKYECMKVDLKQSMVRVRSCRVCDHDASDQDDRVCDVGPEDAQRSVAKVSLHMQLRYRNVIHNSFAPGRWCILYMSRCP